MNSYPLAIMYSVTLIAACFIVYLFWFKGASKVYTRLAKLESDVSQIAMSQGLQNRGGNPMRPPNAGGLK
jgi:multidrug resistance efflux pump